MSNVMKLSSVAAVLLACAPIAHAKDRTEPILTVSGAMIEAETTFDLDALMQLPVTSIETSTIWTEGVSTFTGVSLADLVVELGAEGGTIVATAVNDYTVEIPMEDAVEGGPIVAYLRNDEEMSLREKGPLWVVYPYDSDASYRSEVIYSRSIWQLDRLEFID